MTSYARPLILALALLALGASLGRAVRSLPDHQGSDLHKLLRHQRDRELRGGPRRASTRPCVASRSRRAASIWSALVLLLAARGMRRARSGCVDASPGYIFVLATVGLSAVLYLATRRSSSSARRVRSA